MVGQGIASRLVRAVTARASGQYSMGPQDEVPVACPQRAASRKLLAAAYRTGDRSVDTLSALFSPRMPDAARGALAALTVLAAVSVARCSPIAGTATLPLVDRPRRGRHSYSVTIQTLLFSTALAFLPAVLCLMTGFTENRDRLSLPAPGDGSRRRANRVVIGLSLFLTSS